jgi:hypothetical protein
LRTDNDFNISVSAPVTPDQPRLSYPRVHELSSSKQHSPRRSLSRELDPPHSERHAADIGMIAFAVGYDSDEQVRILFINLKYYHRSALFSNVSVPKNKSALGAVPVHVPKTVVIHACHKHQYVNAHLCICARKNTQVREHVRRTSQPRDGDDYSVFSADSAPGCVKTYN